MTDNPNDRRRFLKTMGLAGAAGAAVVALPGLSQAASTAGSPLQV